MRSRSIAGGAAIVLAAAGMAIVLVSTSGQDGEASAAVWPAARVALATVTRAEAPRAFHGVGELQAARRARCAGSTWSPTCASTAA